MSRREAFLRIVEVREGRQCARERRRWKQHISHHAAINRFPIKRSQRAAERRLRDYIKNVHYNFRLFAAFYHRHSWSEPPMTSANLALCLHVIEYQHWLRKKLCHSLRRGHKSRTFFAFCWHSRQRLAIENVFLSMNSSAKHSMRVTILATGLTSNN